MARPKPPPSADTELSHAQVADLLGITPGRLYQLRRGDFPPPANDDGKFPIVPLGAWLREYVVRRKRSDFDPAATPGKLDATHELARKNRALADKTELENKERRGELLEATAVEFAWMTILSRVRTRMLQIPTTAAPLLVGEVDQHTIREQIDDLVRDALTELSGNWKQAVIETEDE